MNARLFLGLLCLVGLLAMAGCGDPGDTPPAPRSQTNAVPQTNAPPAPTK
jgi:hypothetical protein